MLTIKNLSKSFNEGTENEINIFNNFNLEVEESEFVAVLGSNGCGKSTLFNLISGSLKENSGTITLSGKNISSLKEEDRALKIGKVHQDPTKGVSPALTILVVFFKLSTGRSLGLTLSTRIFLAIAPVCFPNS